MCMLVKCVSVCVCMLVKCVSVCVCVCVRACVCVCVCVRVCVQDIASAALYESQKHKKPK